MSARNPFGHVDLRVRDLQAALAFYDALLPELGFTEREHGGGWKVWATAAELPRAAYVAVTESPGHVPNENRIAFWVHEPAEVDRLAAVVAAAGAELSGPKRMPYGPDYYAVFFADPSGNPLEIYFRLEG